MRDKQSMSDDELQYKSYRTKWWVQECLICMHFALYQPKSCIGTQNMTKWTIMKNHIK